MARTGPIRGLYTASNGDLYAVDNFTAYWVDNTYTFTALGSIVPGTTPVTMADNGNTLLLADGTPNGYLIDLNSHVMTQIDPTSTSPDETGWYGADKVDFLDTFLMANKPGTPLFYCTDSEATTFPALNFAGKETYADGLVSLAVIKSFIWLFGQYTSEVWYNTGGSALGSFPFERYPGTFINRGCAAKYSVAKGGQSVFWLSQNLNGTAMVMRGDDFVATRISTHAIEVAISGYAVISDAVGMVYQQQGHGFYVLTFPTADKTWVYDTTTGFWHERCWIDATGAEHRHRMSCVTFAYDKIVVGDWENANIYSLEPDVQTDFDGPMKFLRSFPHLVEEAHRIVHNRFVADMQVGDIADTAPVVSLRWSDTRGSTWNAPVQQTLGAVGDFYTSVQWRRLGMARDRVYELSWTEGPTALQGAWIDVVVARS